MPTAAQSAREIGGRVLLDHLGESFTYGSLTFLGDAKKPLNTNAGLPRGTAFGDEFELEIEALASDFGGALPKPGGSIGYGGRTYRIAGVVVIPGCHKITIRVIQPR